MFRHRLRSIAFRAAGPVALFAALAFAPAAMSGCGKGGGSSATGPSSSNTTSACSSASFDSSAGIGFALGCNSVSASVSGITYDQFSRRIAYNYDISCSDGSNRKQGRVFNVVYNNIGQALTWDFTVNGTSCKKS